MFVFCLFTFCSLFVICWFQFVLYFLCLFTVCYIYMYVICLLSVVFVVLHGHSGFSSPPQRPMTSMIFVSVLYAHCLFYVCFQTMIFVSVLYAHCLFYVCFQIVPFYPCFQFSFYSLLILCLLFICFLCVISLRVCCFFFVHC